MCGIIAAFNTTTEEKSKATDVNEYIINQYQEQYARGTEGYGIIRINKKQEVDIDRACEPTKFLIDLTLKKSEMIIAHHRHPTSTSNRLPQTHPLIINNDKLKYNYLVVHNGIISNDKELREKHLKLGFIYQTECMEGYYATSTKKTLRWNDSESISIELALFIENQIKTIRTDNMATFVILQISKKTGKAEQVFFGRNRFGALKMSKTRGKLRLSSEGEGEEIKANKLYSFKLNDKYLKLSNQDIEFKTEGKIELIKTEKEEEKAIDEDTISKVNENKIAVIKQNQTDKTFESNNENLRPYRSWINYIDDDMVNDQDVSPPINQTRYIREACIDIKEALKETNANQISHIIDDKLDDQVTAITELINEFKSIVYTDKLHKDEITWYINQIGILMKTMTFITNIAEATYEKKSLKEERENQSDFHEEDFPTHMDPRHYDMENQERLGY